MYLSLPPDVWLVGDSHGFDLAMEIGLSKFKTLGGYGIFSMFDIHTLRPVPQSFSDGAIRVFSGFTQKDVVLLSYLDTEARSGIGDRSGADFEKYYEDVVIKTLHNLRTVSKYKKLVFLDTYGVIRTPAEEQTCSPEKRNQNRKLVSGLIKKHCHKYDADIFTVMNNLLFVDQDGFVRDRAMIHDNVHYNLNYVLPNSKTIKEELIQGILDIVK